MSMSFLRAKNVYSIKVPDTETKGTLIEGATGLPYLDKGDVVLFHSETASGKSSLIMQMCMRWACGYGFGFGTQNGEFYWTPERELRTLLFNYENKARVFVRQIESISAFEQWSPQDKKLVSENFFTEAIDEIDDDRQRCETLFDIDKYVGEIYEGTITRNCLTRK